MYIKPQLLSLASSEGKTILPGSHPRIASRPRWIHRMPSGASIDDVVSAINVQRISRDQFGAIEGQKRSRPSNIVDADQAPGRRFRLRPVHQFVEFRNA